MEIPPTTRTEEEISSRYSTISESLQRYLQDFYNLFINLGTLRSTNEEQRGYIREIMQEIIDDGRECFPTLDSMMMTGEYTPTETDLEHISELNTLVQYLNEQALNFTSDEARKAHTKLKAFLYGGRSP